MSILWKIYQCLVFRSCFFRVLVFGHKPETGNPLRTRRSRGMQWKKEQWCIVPQGRTCSDHRGKIPPDSRRPPVGKTLENVQMVVLYIKKIISKKVVHIFNSMIRNKWIGVYNIPHKKKKSFIWIFVAFPSLKNVLCLLNLEKKRLKCLQCLFLYVTIISP